MNLCVLCVVFVCVVGWCLCVGCGVFLFCLVLCVWLVWLAVVLFVVLLVVVGCCVVWCYSFLVGVLLFYVFECIGLMRGIDGCIFCFDVS
jgi:hypothetical protein